MLCFSFSVILQKIYNFTGFKRESMRNELAGEKMA